MKNKFDFFHLYYPQVIADSCNYFKSINGIYIDLPAIIKEEHKNVEYENAEKIKFQDSIYLKANKNTKIKLNMPIKNHAFYYGVINISDNDNLSFLYWFNINNKTQFENIKHYLENNLKIGLMKGSNEKCLIAVWLGYEK